MSNSDLPPNSGEREAPSPDREGDSANPPASHGTATDIPAPSETDGAADTSLSSDAHAPSTQPDAADAGPPWRDNVGAESARPAVAASTHTLNDATPPSATSSHDVADDEAVSLVAASAEVTGDGEAADDLPPAAPRLPLPRVPRQLPHWQLPAWLRAEWPITAIVLIAAALRIFGYNWDEGTELHPDERGIVGHIQSIGLPHSWSEFWSPNSPLNPHFSAYGHLPFYATAVFVHILGALGRAIGGPLAGLAQADTTSIGIIESGRVLSGLADAGTLVFVYLIGRLVFGRAVGLLAALLGCFTVLNLEFSHFANVDTYLSFCVLGALYFCVRIARLGRPRDYAWVGMWIGFAIACKISAAPLIVPLIVAHVYRGAERDTPDADTARLQSPSFAMRRQSQPNEARSQALPANPLLLLMALAVAAATVFVTMPYAFIDFNGWWNDVWQQLQLAQGITESPFTRKFSGLPSYYYELQQLIGWTLGLPLGLSAVAGVLVAIGRQFRWRRGTEMVLLAWVVIFIGTAAGQYMKFLRYMLPLSPVLTLFAAALLVGLWRWAGRRRPLPRLSARGIVLSVTVLTILYGLSYETIYAAENTRVAAARWTAAHVPAGSVILTEGGWDEQLPGAAAPAGLTLPIYGSLSIDMLGAGDSPAIVQQYVQALQTAQYYIVSSARIFGSVAHQPGRYPYTIRWYDLLFSGRLDFKLIKSFTHPLGFGPLRINEYQAPPRAGYYDHLHLWYEADQNLTEYNAPPVYIFKRVGTMDAARATALLTHDDKGRLLVPAVAAYNPAYSMLLPKKVEQADQQAPTYNSVFPPNNPLARIPLLSWLVMIELLGLLALPLLMRACRNLLRDGGYALAKLCGIVIVGYLTWLAASLHIAVYSRGLTLASCLVLLLLSLAFGLRPRALWAEVRARRRGMLWAEAIFLGAFLAMALVRMAYPDLWHMYWGGERSQELSFMNSILRSQYFPPADPWFAGGTLNYYYYGQYLTGMLMKLIGIPVPIAFNLALPTLYALLLSIAFSIGFNATGRAWVGGAAAALEGVLGNLGPIQQLAALSPTHVGASYIPGVAGLVDAISGFVAVLTRQVQLPSDFFWTSSRILSTNAGNAINEYPIWSFTYGDMHAHVIDMPILLGVVLLALAASGLGIARTLRPQSPRAAMRPRVASPQSQALGLAMQLWVASPQSQATLPQLLLLGALMAVVAGATGPTNLWDLPTALAILVIGFGLRGWFVAERRGWALVLRDFALPGAVLGLLCLLLYRPFYSSVLGLTSGFTFLAPTTPTDEYLLHFGLPIFLLTSFWLVFLLQRARLVSGIARLFTVLEFGRFYQDQEPRLPHLFSVAGAITRRARPQAQPPSAVTLHVLIFGAFATVGLLILGFTTPALVAVLVTLGGAALTEALARSHYLDTQESQPFALVLAVMALVLTIIPDFVMQNEAGRMNTSFKLYNQAWPLLAIAGALALSALVRRRHAEAAATVAQPVAAAREPVPALALAPAMAGADGAWASSSPMGGGWSARAYSTQAPDEMAPPREAEAPSPSPGGVGVVDESRPDQQDGAAEGAPVAEAAEAAPRGVRKRPTSPPQTGWVPNWRGLWWAALAVLVWGGLLFPTFGIYSHLQIRAEWPAAAAANVPDGLDGAAFVRKMYPGDWAAIQWINAHITGMPVMLTSTHGSDRNFATRVTMFTGLPNIISWPWEVSQQRYAGQNRPQSDYPPNWINQLDSGRVTWNGQQWVNNLPQTSLPAPGTRSSDADLIYNTPDPQVALPLLREYHVSYIYVGVAEIGNPDSDDLQTYGRVGFDPAGLTKFDRMAAGGQLRVVYDRLGVTIYKVV